MYIRMLEGMDMSLQGIRINKLGYTCTLGTVVLEGYMKFSIRTERKR